MFLENVSNLLSEDLHDVMKYVLQETSCGPVFPFLQ